MDFEIYQNDITNIQVDAIVLPANEKLKEGKGSSRAIFEKAGRKQLTAACKEIAPCKVGDVVPTLAFDLDANYIIHAVVPKWIDGEHQEYDYLSAAYLSALNVADIMECESIAFPLLASGNNGFDLGLAYEIAKTSIESFEGVHIRRVVLVIYGDNVCVYLKGRGVKIQNFDDKVTELCVVNQATLPAKQIKKDAKVIAKKMLEEQIKKAIEYLKEEKNREKVVAAGIAIAAEVFKLVAKKVKH